MWENEHDTFSWNDEQTKNGSAKHFVSDKAMNYGEREQMKHDVMRWFSYWLNDTNQPVSTLPKDKSPLQASQESMQSSAILYRPKERMQYDLEKNAIAHMNAL